MPDTKKSASGKEIHIAQNFTNEILFDYDAGAECVIFRHEGHIYTVCRVPEKKATPEMLEILRTLPGRLNNNSDISQVIQVAGGIIRNLLSRGD